MFCVRADELTEPIALSNDGAKIAVKVRDTITLVTEFHLVVKKSRGFTLPEWADEAVVIYGFLRDGELVLEYTYSTMRQWKKYRMQQLKGFSKVHIGLIMREEILQMADSVYDVYHGVHNYLRDNVPFYSNGFWIADKWYADCDREKAPLAARLLIDNQVKRGLFGMYLLTDEEKHALKTIQAHIQD